MLKKLKRAAIILLIMLISLILIFSWRTLTRNVLVLKSSQVSLEQSDDYADVTMTIQQQKTLRQYSKDYAYIYYDITLKNKSKDMLVSCIEIIPEFYGDIKKHIFLSKFDGSEDYTIKDFETFDPNTQLGFGQRVLINRKNLSDEQVLKLAKNVKFKIKYITYPTLANNNFLLQLLTFCFNSQELGYKNIK